MKDEVAGDPVSGCKWSRKSTYTIAEQCNRLKIRVSPSTVARLLKAQNFSLRKNRKNIESASSKRIDPQQRDRQFCYIKRQRRSYEGQDLPVLSIDTKSRELIGSFCQQGRRWHRGLIEVFDHDFPSRAQGVGISYGVYDTGRNHGFVCVGTSSDTSQFAVDTIRKWWLQVGAQAYPRAEEILLLGDCGGSNSCRNRLWKHQLQEGLCDRLGLKVRVCNYPHGASKWNPIEHRMFSFISGNWAAQPLDSYETMLKFIRTTQTQQGLRVRACLNNKKYTKGIKVSDEQMEQIQLKRYRVNPKWNYSIHPG